MSAATEKIVDRILAAFGRHQDCDSSLCDHRNSEEMIARECADRILDDLSRAGQWRHV